jgi:acid phosphatase
VAGYEVYRDGARVATVRGATAWTDSTVQPSTPYAYTVDAFDAAGNVSTQSSPANVTTPEAGGSPPPIVLIMMENKPASAIAGNPNAPNIQSMIASGTLFSNVVGVAGSYHNYLANTSGLTDSAGGSDNIFHQLQAAGRSWGEYEESMPSDCYKGGDVGSYKHGHNPAVYYSDITSSPAACANVVTLGAFDPWHLRAFSYVVPNLAHDMHDGATSADQIAAGDAWLAANVPAMLSAGAEVLLTWDEGTKANEHVAAILVGGAVPAGVVDTTAYSHPGLLAGLELRFGLPRLNAAATATPVPIP